MYCLNWFIFFIRLMWKLKIKLYLSFEFLHFILFSVLFCYASSDGWMVFSYVSFVSLSLSHSHKFSCNYYAKNCSMYFKLKFRWIRPKYFECFFSNVCFFSCFDISNFRLTYTYTHPNTYNIFVSTLSVYVNTQRAKVSWDSIILPYIYIYTFVVCQFE